MQRHRLAPWLQLRYRPEDHGPRLLEAAVILGNPGRAVEHRRLEEPALRCLDCPMYVAVTDHGTRAQLLGDALEVTFNISPPQRRGSRQNGIHLSIRERDRLI
jgi:hypothetical protein